MKPRLLLGLKIYQLVIELLTLLNFLNYFLFLNNSCMWYAILHMKVARIDNMKVQPLHDSLPTLVYGKLLGCRSLSLLHTSEVLRMCW